MTNNNIGQMEPWFDTSEEQAVAAYLKSGGWITEFKITEELEKVIAGYLDVKYCVMTTNGTVSLILALLALDIQAGDEVLVPNLTMIATPNAAALLKIKPVLVDIEKDTLCMDLQKAREAITSKTKAIIYVALNGRSGDMNALLEFAKKNRLLLIEDAAQAFGSCHNGKYLGTFGNIGSFSFSTQKVISTGQGGALVTNNRKFYKKLKKLKDFGRIKGGIDTHNTWGWNFKFTDLQAVIGIEQMKKLPTRLKRKKEIYQRYKHALEHISNIEFIDTNLADISPWFIDIYVKNPDRLCAYLGKQHIGTRRIYPPLSKQKIYRDSWRDKKFPISVRYSHQGIWLPSSAALSNREIDTVIAAIKKFYFQND